MLLSDDSRTIVHLDLDAFFVSIECLHNKELRNRPLVIGGNSNRGVVACCSYEARRFGIQSAMPIYLAKQLCPDVTIISGDMEAYSEYSHAITAIIHREAPLFEKASIDEFYIDMSGMERFFGCYRWAKALREKIIQETDLPISMGISINKLVAKMATNESKPNGQHKVSRGSERDFIGPLSIQKLPSLGEKTAHFLFNMGIRRVKTLRAMPVKMLQAAFGKNGIGLWKKANAIDDSPVVPFRERKSISTETTFQNDTIDVKKIHTILTGMVEKLAFKMRRERKLTGCVTVKVRYTSFDTVTKQRQIPYTSADHILIEIARQLFDKLYTRRLLIRLVGVSLSELVCGSYQIDLFKDTAEDIQLYQAIDRIKFKHGNDKIMRASTLGMDRRIRQESNPFMS